MSPGVVRAILSSLNAHLACELCKQSLDTRINDVIVRWSLADVSDKPITFVISTHAWPAAHHLNALVALQSPDCFPMISRR